MQSILQQRGPVTFPEGGPERHYMIPFKKATGVELGPNTCWAGSAMSLLHYATPQRETAVRTLVRLNVVGWEPI